MKPASWLVAPIAVALIASACGATIGESVVATDSPGQEAARGDPSSAPALGVLPKGPSALDDPRSPAFPDPLVPVAEIISGGPPPDGIPPIDDPRFLEVIDHLDLLDDSESVVALEVNGDARAYPVRALIWHEIVNDTVGGVPVTVTYCPLCNSAVSYRREVRGVETTFGTSGRLYASALVMYDRATESLWTHFDGRAVVGVLTGERLDALASPLMSWEIFRRTYPTGKVLDWTQTGFRRDYGVNPYTGYDDPATDPFLFRGDLDERAAAKQRVVGVELGESAVAFSLDGLTGEAATATNSEVDSTPIVIFWSPGQASALERASLSAGRDVGTVGVFDPVVGGQTLHFEAEGGAVRDVETGTRWSLVGEALDGPLAGTTLTRIAHLDTFWFAWSTYKPGTALVAP